MYIDSLSWWSLYNSLGRARAQQMLELGKLFCGLNTQLSPNVSQNPVSILEKTIFRLKSRLGTGVV